MTGRDTAGGDFWTRRKAAVQAEQQADDRATDAALAAEREVALEEKTDAEILADLNLPDPDTLTQGDDFKVFLKETVPARIRTRALRRLWITNPVLANVDGLVDYGENFNDPSFIIENMQTAYQVGKGMLAHVEEMMRKEAGEADDAAPATAETEPPQEETPQQAPEAVAATQEEPDTNTQDTTKVWVASAPPTDETETDVFASGRAPAPRRMRFEFEG